MELLFHDDVKDKLCTTQNLLKRDELDTSNSVPEKVFDYFQSVADVFNANNFVAVVPAMPFLHEGMKKTQSIELGDFILTRDKVKTVYGDMR